MPTDNVTTKASGYCGKLEQNLTLEWSAKNITNGSMTLHFMKNATENDYSLHHLEVFLPASDFPSNLKLSKQIYFVINNILKKNIFIYLYYILKNIIGYILIFLTF